MSFCSGYGDNGNYDWEAWVICAFSYSSPMPVDDDDDIIKVKEASVSLLFNNKCPTKASPPHAHQDYHSHKVNGRAQAGGLQFTM